MLKTGDLHPHQYYPRSSRGVPWPTLGEHVEHSSKWVNPKSHWSYLCAGKVFLAKEKENAWD